MTDRQVKTTAVLTVLLVTGVATAAFLSTPPGEIADVAAQDGGPRLEQVFEHIKLQQPVWMEQAPGSDRWYVLEQPGRVVSFPNDPDTKSREVVLDITDRVKDGGERGLLGLAFHPEFATNGLVYLSYTAVDDGQLESRISRFSRGTGLKIDPNSEKILFEVDQPYSNHNGGQISFGPDGKLYIALGDGGSGGDPQGHGQDVGTALGSMLRIDVDGGDPYAIPSDNPRPEGAVPEAWAWGLRNPWRFSFDRATGKMWAGDVGQNAWEEIDVIERGKNYGWNVLEGTHCYPPSSKSCDAEKFTPPVTEYSQSDGDRSVTGGYVYRGKQWKSLVGHYVFGDFVSGKIWAFDPDKKQTRLLLDSSALISSFVQARDGEIGVLDYGPGRVFHLRGE